MPCVVFFPISLRRMADQPAPEILTAFNRVLHAIFSHTTIIPFRFPTVVENEGVLRQFLESRSSDYRAALHRLHNKVQMDVRLILEPGVPAPEAPPSIGQKLSWSISRARHQEIQSVLDKFRLCRQFLRRRAGCSAIPLPALAVSRSWIVPRSLFSSRRSAASLPLPASRRVSLAPGPRVNSWKSRMTDQPPKKESPEERRPSRRGYLRPRAGRVVARQYRARSCQARSYPDRLLAATARTPSHPPHGRRHAQRGRDRADG